MAARNGRLLMTTVLVIAGSLLGIVGVSSDTKPRPRYPMWTSERTLFAARRQAQIDTEKQFKVFYQFHFTDKLKESGITFVNHAVDDVTLHMKAAHYDHGTGIAVADVDGDGLYDIYFVNQVGGNELWKNIGGGNSRTSRKRPASACPGASA